MSGITRDLAKDFRADFKEVVKSLEEKHNVTIKIGTITMNQNDMTCKMTTKLNEVGGKPIEEVEFKRYASSFGFKESDYNRKIKLNDGFFHFYGFNPNARKNVCLLRKVGTNKGYHAPKRTITENFVK